MWLYDQDFLLQLVRFFVMRRSANSTRINEFVGTRFIASVIYHCFNSKKSNYPKSS